MEPTEPTMEDGLDHVELLRGQLRARDEEIARLKRACGEGLRREPIDCPRCGGAHVDGEDGEAFATHPHHTHRCKHCGNVWDEGRWSFGVARVGPRVALIERMRDATSVLRDRDGRDEDKLHESVIVVFRGLHDLLFGDRSAPLHPLDHAAALGPSDPQREILRRVMEERARSDDGTLAPGRCDVDRSLTDGPDPVVGGSGLIAAMTYSIPPALAARRRADDARRAGRLTWAHLLVESVSGAVEAAAHAQDGQGREDEADQALERVMAVVLAWLEDRAVRLHCFTNGTDTVSAHDEADAALVLREVYGDSTEAAAGLRRLRDGESFSLWEDIPALQPGERCARCGFGLATSRNGHQTDCPIGNPTRTAREWAAQGRGLISTREA